MISSILLPLNLHHICLARIYSARIYSKQERGFSLIEMAIVMVILGALLGGLLMPLSAQRDVSNRKTTETQLAEIRNALIGYAIQFRTLPCPSPAGSGLAPPAPCPAANRGVPYETLGVDGVQKNGNLVDVWQMPIIYRVHASFVQPITAASVPVPLLRICNAQPCNDIPISPTRITNNAVAVIFSTGKDGPEVPVSTSPDQVLNRTPGTNFFVMRTLNELSGSEFDDIVIWISQPQLIYDLSKAGRL